MIPSSAESAPVGRRRPSLWLRAGLLILAAVTTIFMPLTLITGLIGMNVAGIPFAQEPWAFLAIIGVLALLGVLEFLWFRSRKWL